MKKNQATIARTAEVRGRGLHSGRDVLLRFVPAGPDRGIRFVRTDAPDSPEIPASLGSVSGAQVRHTVLQSGNASVETPEHVLASCLGMGIDNLRIEMDSPETPAGDGSASVFVEALSRAERVEQDAPKKEVRVKRPVHVKGPGGGEIWALPNPGRGLTVSYELSYDNPLLKNQKCTYKFEGGGFESLVAPARTFCLEREVEMLKKAGFGKGADLDNTLVVDDLGSVIGNELRFADECARHKLLDLIGDLSLAGAAIEAHVIASKTGHAANHRIVRKLLQEFEPDRPHQDEISSAEILGILPHKYPFLMVDRITAVDGDSVALGVKNLSCTEEFFTGHFPGRPMMPGVLQLEAMAQVAGVLLLKQRRYEGKISVIVSMDQIRFRRRVLPGDRLDITARIEKVKSRTAQVSAFAAVEGERASEARFRFMLTDDKENR